MLRVFIVCTCLILFAQPLQAQRRKSAAERQRIMEQIRLSHTLLKKTNSRQDESIVALATLNNQIKLQESLVQNYRDELVNASAEIDSLENRLCEIEEEMLAIRNEYAHLANVTYRKLGNENRMLYILGAKSLGEAYARVSYFKQIGRHRQRQVSLLEENTLAIQNQKVLLAEKIAERKSLINAERQELSSLQESKSEHNSLYFTLKDKEDSYRSRLIKQRQNLRGLLAAAEKKSTPKATPAVKPAPAPKPKQQVQKTNPAPKQTTKAKPAKAPVRPATTPALTGKFASNRGKLPWPVAKSNSILAGKFGPAQDAFGNRITNDGVFLQTPQNASVNAVFPGTVTGVTEVPLSGILVIIEHGNYRTAYAGLKGVSVKVGSKVEEGQRLGQVFTDGRTGETMLQFMVYRAPNRFENPARWLRR